jgi:signal transduction histidine kinase
VAFSAPATLPALSTEAELALFRALQEALSNVRRHAAAGSVEVALTVDRSGLRLVVRDDGRGPPDTPERLEGAGHMGLAGMRERISALGGSVRFAGARGTGASLEVLVPVAAGAGA